MAAVSFLLQYINPMTEREFCVANMYVQPITTTLTTTTLSISTNRCYSRICRSIISAPVTSPKQGKLGMLFSLRTETRNYDRRKQVRQQCHESRILNRQKKFNNMRIDPEPEPYSVVVSARCWVADLRQKRARQIFPKAHDLHTQLRTQTHGHTSQTED